MQNVAYRFRSLLFLSLICAFLIGVADGILAMTTHSGPEGAVFLTVCALSMTVSVIIAPFFAIVVALISFNSGNLPGIPAKIAAALHPRSLPARRAGALLAAEIVCFTAAYLTIVAAADATFADRIETGTYAAVSTALVALFLGVTIVRLAMRLHGEQSARFASIFRDHPDGHDGPAARIANFLLTPWVVLLAAFLAGVLLLIPRISTVFEILNALPLRPLGVVATSVAVAAAIGIIFDFRRVPGWIRLAVYSTVTLVSAVLAAVAVSGVLVDDQVRLGFKSDDTVSSAMYDIVSTFADYDGDGLLDIMNDGDCEPRNERISASGIEIADNGVDEDCDGSDLSPGAADDQFQGRWDFPVPDEIRGRRYNVLLITLDAAAPDHMSLYGYHRKNTPNLERIASGAALFTKAFAPGPATRLSIPAVMTSKYGPQMDVVTGRRVPVEEFPSNRLMSEILRRSGYRTYAVTSTSFFSNWKDILRGFDHVENLPAAYDSESNQNHSGAQVTASTLALLQEASSTLRQPFFMWVHYYDLHMPYTAIPGATAYGDSDADIYDSEMAYLDEQVGRLVDGLDRYFDPSNTILIIMADHGEAFDSNHVGRPHGQDLYTTAVHIPMIVRAPFVGNSVFNGPVSGIDILPTLVNLLGIQGTYRFRGMSLVPQLADGAEDPGRSVLSISYTPEDIEPDRPFQMAATRTSSTSYIWDLEANTHQVFDYVKDPYELNDLSAVNPEKTREMKVLAAMWVAWVEARNREGLPED